MKFYTYNQNNSGGAFTDPAKYVIIEADSPEEADERAEEHDLYFNGVDAGIDCKCCGDRWLHTWDDGTDKPEVYGEPPEKIKPIFRVEGIPVVVLLRKGAKEYEVLVP